MDSEFLEQLKQMAELDIPENFSLDKAIESSTEEMHTSSMNSIDSLQITLEEHTHMPAYLKEQMINRTKQPDMQPVSVKRKRSKRLELFLYSCKVSAAVAASLAIIITVSATQSSISELPDNSYSATGSLLQDNTSENEDWNVETSEVNNKTYKKNDISKKINDSSRSITNWLQTFPDKILKQEK